MNSTLRMLVCISCAVAVITNSSTVQAGPTQEPGKDFQIQPAPGDATAKTSKFQQREIILVDSRPNQDPIEQVTETLTSHPSAVVAVSAAALFLWKKFRGGKGKVISGGKKTSEDLEFERDVEKQLEYLKNNPFDCQSEVDSWQKKLDESTKKPLEYHFARGMAMFRFAK